jgi:twitching motility protein PilT
MAEATLQPIEPMLEEMWKVGATDLHLTAESPPLMRVDGSLTPVPGQAHLDRYGVGNLIVEILGSALSERLASDREVDASFGWGDRARLRANAYYQRGALTLALRIIPYHIPSFDELGVPEPCRRLTELPQGLVLVTGPTGSGKSTTLAAMIDAINEQRACHIVTIEDPIEYVHRNKWSAVEQREIGIDTHSFERALRSAFREDPDVLLVGEMRDNETISATLTLAETGHLVFATLHTNDAAQTIDRIVDVFPGEQQSQIRVQLAGSLQAVVSQRLVPKVESGMVAAFEVLMATHAARNIVRDGRTNQLRNLILTGIEYGMQSLEMSLTALVAQGLVTYEEAVAHSLFPQEVKRPAA